MKINITAKTEIFRQTHVNMFEAKLTESNTFKRIVEAIKDLVNDVNLDVGPAGKYHAHCTENKLSSFDLEALTILLAIPLTLLGISL